MTQQVCCSIVLSFSTSPLMKWLLCLQEQLVLPVSPKKPFPTGLCCLTVGLVIFMSGLVMASIYVYRYYYIPQVSPLFLPARHSVFMITHRKYNLK